MRRLAILSLFTFALIMSVPAVEASTPGQATGIAAKVKADALARFKAQALAKARADAVAKARTEAVAKSKIKAISAFSVRTEAARRAEAAGKATKINIQVTSFQTTSLTHQSHVSKKRVSNIAESEGRKNLLVRHHDESGIAHHVHGGQKATEARVSH